MEIFENPKIIPFLREHYNDWALLLLMYKDRQNKIPQPRTIARHYAEGKYCDYPTDIVLSAVNSHDYEYNPTAIPIKLGFIQIFRACLKTIVNGSEFPESNYHSSHHEHFIGRTCCFLVISA